MFDMWSNRKSPNETSGYPDDWKHRKRKTFHSDNWTCQGCGRAGGPKGNAELHAHHKLPKSKGGSHHLDNLTTLCDKCHAEYHDDPRLLATTNGESNPLRAHLKLAFLTGWWSFGLGNAAYEVGRRFKEHKTENRDKKRKKGLAALREEELRREQGLTSSWSWSKQHKRVFRDYGWWTFGLGNLIYEIFRQPGPTQRGEDGLPRLGKRDGKKGFWQNRVDKARNKTYDGCPSCGERSLTVSWLKLDDGSKAKVIECTTCQIKYEETNTGLRKVTDVNDLDSGGSAFLQELFG